MSGRSGRTRTVGRMTRTAATARTWPARLPSSLSPWQRSVIPVFLCLVGGCESITGGGISYAEVTVFGTAPTEAGGSGGEQGAEATLLEGEVEVRLRVILGGGTGFPISISAGDRTVTVPIGGDASVSLGRPSLVPGVYQGVRVVFTEVTATVTSGLGPGSSTGPKTVTVAFGVNGSNPIGPDRSLVLRGGDELQVTVDLQAPVWIGSGVPGGGPWVVPAAVFEEAVRVQTRVR